MSQLMSEAATVHFIGESPWPDNVRLFQPYEVGQILMHDFASCLSVKTFLNMLGLKFQTELRSNAEYMSPSGKVPFIQVDSLLVSELEPIIAVASAKRHSLSSELSDVQRAEMKAYMSLVQSTFVNALLYILWHDAETAQVTKSRCGSPYKWPLNVLIPLKKQYEVSRLLSLLGWSKKSLPEVYDEVNTVCQALSEKLGDSTYFFGSKPTELDAVVFGHLYTMLTTKLPCDRLAEIVRSYPNLAGLCSRVHDQYFAELHKDVGESVGC